MSKQEQNRQAEQHRVNKVTDYITSQINHLEGQLGKIKHQVVSIRKHFWDDVTVNMDNADDLTETFASMKQQAEVLSEQERTHNHMENQLKKLNRLEQSPYFGRIDFREEGLEASDQIYIGIASLQSEDGMDFLIYDWRAPVSSLYYDHGPGPAAYETPGGTMNGVMELKRQFIIRDKEIRSLFDTGITIGDELLKEVLGGNADHHMKTIVATIQQEQNQIIRNDSGRLLIVQGAAGSGKTSAALQRAAYLLYRYRGTIQADQLVLFSPNPMFNSYVSTVLPELGEENMQQTTFQEYLEHRIGRIYDLEDSFDQLEMLYTSKDEEVLAARRQGIAFKTSLAFMQALDRYKKALEEDGMIFNSIKFRGEVIISKEQIRDKFYSFDSRWLARLEQLKEWLTGKLLDWEEHEWQEDWVRDEIDLLDNETYQKIYSQMRKANRGKSLSFDDYDREAELLSHYVVKQHFKPLHRKVRLLKFIPIFAMYRKLFSSKDAITPYLSQPNEQPELWANICTQSNHRFEQKKLPYEDTTPFLYFKDLIEGFRSNLNVRHVFIDEAQDYSPFQFEYLKRLFPSSRMTVLGDINQGIYGHASSLSDFSQLKQLFGEEHSEIIRLNRSYRSTFEIIQFTKGILRNGESIEPFERHGNKPTVYSCSKPELKIQQMIQQIQKLKQKGLNSIAIICKTAKESIQAYEQLKQQLDLTYITKTTPSFEGGIVVLPVYLAKGVEFEAVLIHDCSDEKYGEEVDRKLFYTACTRAMHELYLYTEHDISRFITGLSKDNYEISNIHTAESIS
jgi:DNA helicase-2/ATP-dependent DNA helicase PcrA